MKKLHIHITILIFISSLANAQDGSDIIYVDSKKVDSTLIGKYIQIDFHNYSFGSNKFPKVKADTISLKFKEFESFIEIRNDDHYNNWFSEQYLESINERDGLKLRIRKMKLLEVSNDSIEVKLFGHYFENEKEIFSKYQTEIKKLSRKDINQLLVDANPPIRKGLSIYRVYEYFPDFTKENKPECYYCFDITDENLFDHTLISDWQIKNFDYENQKIELTESGKRQIEKLEIPLQGMPVVLTLNGEIIYGFWLWNSVSSFGCDRVFSYPKLDFKLKFGLPNTNTFGIDPRFDERLKKYSESK